MKFKKAFLLLLFFGFWIDLSSQKSEFILPTPDSTFFNRPIPLGNNIIEKHLKSYFKITKPLPKIRECGDSCYVEVIKR